MDRLISLILLIALLIVIPAAPGVAPLPPAGASDLFMWTDDGGIRHYSNIAPPESVDSVQSREETLTIPKGFSCRVTKVYDGDTIRVKGEELAFKVRLAGIDCPESAWKKMPEQPFAKEAKEALTDLVLDRDVVLKQYGVGGYNRVLAEVFYRDQNINLTMVRLGLAEIYRGRLPQSLDADELKQAEKEARRKGVGIWSLGTSYISPKTWRRRFLTR